MPQYLGIDYLHHALEKNCAFLSFALLPVPDHLEKVENYPHKGLPSEHDIRQFQNTGIILTELSCDEDIWDNEDISENLKLLCEEMEMSPLELYSNESLPLSEEIVFSSFNSPDSGEIIYIQDSPENKLQSEEFEIFNKANIQEIKKETGKDHNWYLEDVYCSNLFKECLEKLPTLKTYIERLSFMKIADPLLSSDGTLLSENKFFQNNFSFPLEVEPNPPENKELFLPIKDLHLETEKSNCFEEIMTLAFHSGLTITRLNLQQIKDMLQFHQLDLQLDHKDLSTMLTESGTSQLFTEFQESLSQSEVIKDDACSLIEKQVLPDFPCPHLETPLTSLVKEKIDKSNLFHLLEIIPFDMREETNYVLSPKSVNKVHLQFWQEEKFCDEISTLRLPEPLVENTACVQSYIKDALESLKYSPENILSEMDLVLPWDPFPKSVNIKNYFLETYPENPVSCHQHFEDLFVKNKDFNEVPNQDQLLDPNELHKSIQWSSNSSYITKPAQQTVISNINDVNLGLNPLDDFFMMRIGTKDSKITSETSHYPIIWSLLYKMDFIAKHNWPIKQVKYKGGRVSPSQKKALKLRTLSPDDPKTNIVVYLNFYELDSQRLSKKNCADRIRGILKAYFFKKNVKKGFLENNKNDMIQSNEYRIVENILNISISSEFNFLLQEIINSAKPFMKLLQASGDLSPSKIFQDLQPDRTGFLLKQKKKTLQNSDKKDCSNEELEALNAVHILVSTADVLLNCCFESATIHLSEMIEKDSLQGCLENLRNTFFKTQNHFLQENITHPKIVSATKEIEKWRLQNQIKSNFNGKILVITERDLPGLMAAILDHIILGTKTKAEILDSNLNKNIKERLSTSNSDVILMQESMITESFPWSLFSLVIQYEHNKKSPDYLQICESYSVTFCSLQMITDDPSTKHNSTASDSMNIYNDVIKLIGSEAITHNKQLLQLLETRYNIVIIGRMFDQVSEKRRLHFADIIIDERNGIVLSCPSQLKDNQFESFMFRLFSLSLKFTACFVIITQTNSETNKMTDVSCNISKLMGTLTVLNHQTECCYKVLLSYEINETAVLIREISENCLETSKVWSRQEWLEREWLSEDISKEEKFLLNWPCLNSFCAQLMLKSTSMRLMLLLPIEHLKTRFQWLPHQVIKLFHEITNQKKGLQLNVTKIPTISFLDEDSLHNTPHASYEEALESHFLINKKPSPLATIDDLSLATEQITNNDIPHFKYKKKKSADSTSFLDSFEEFPQETTNLEFYPLLSKENRIANNCTNLDDINPLNDFQLSDASSLNKKLLFNETDFDEIMNFSPTCQSDYHSNLTNFPSPINNEIPNEKDSNWISLNSLSSQIRISDDRSQEKRRLSPTKDENVRMTATKKKKEEEEGWNSWTQFFENFKLENGNKKTMVVLPTSPSLTTYSPTFSPVHSQAVKKPSTLLDSFPPENTPNLSSYESSIQNQKFLPSQKPNQKLEPKKIYFSQTSNKNQSGNSLFYEIPFSSHSSYNFNQRRSGTKSKIFPDRFPTNEFEYPHPMKKRINIGLAQPLMRNYQQASFGTNPIGCSQIQTKRMERKPNSKDGLLTKHQQINSPESETLLPSSQFYSGSNNNTPLILTCEGNKKRRLTYEKVPGQKTGQTRLSFS